MCGSTSCYSEYSHDSDDGRVYGQRCAHLQLLQGDSHDGQGYYSYIQLIPPKTHKYTSKHTKKELL